MYAFRKCMFNHLRAVVHVDYHLLNTQFISHRPQNELCLCSDLINQHCVNISAPSAQCTHELKIVYLASKVL